MGIDGIDATEAAIVASMLSSDEVPDENQAAKCFSCDEPLKGLFCSACGQKNDNYRRSIWALIAELVGSVFSLDSRIWRSWAALLFKPGKVAREYSDGKRSYWSSPVRVYLAMSIILFGFMAITQTHLVTLDVDVRIKEGVEKPAEQLLKKDLTRGFDISFFKTQSQIDKRNEDRDFALIQKYLELDMTGGGEDDGEATIEAPGFSLDLGGQTIGAERTSQYLTAFIKNPKTVTDSFNKWLPRLMFIMMPFAMLIGALFIRDRKKALLFDHLVHAAYIHTVTFFLLLMGIFLSRFFFPGVIFPVIIVIMIIYLPISLKRMFGRGWFKTLLTSYSVALVYLLVMTTALIGLIAYDIAQDIKVI